MRPPLGSLELGHRAVGIAPDDSHGTEPCRGSQRVDVTRVQQVEDLLGQHLHVQVSALEHRSTNPSQRIRSDDLEIALAFPRGHGAIELIGLPLACRAEMLDELRAE